MSALKILIVDDEPDIRLELQDFVGDLDFQCVLAANGQEGLQQFRDDPDIHIVLSDLTMPGIRPAKACSLKAILDILNFL